MEHDRASVNDVAIDALGNRHPRVADPATLRIVSLVPSITELLCDLGLAPRLVGRTGFCIHPTDVVDAIAKVGGTKTVNIEKIRKLAPTHLVVNVDENEKPTVETLAGFIPNVIVTHPLGPHDNLALYRLMGHVFAREAEAEALCARFDSVWDAVTRRTWPARRVLYLIWKDPWMTVARDTYVAATLATVGWMQIDVSDVASGGSPRYPAIDLARALRDVDRVLLSSEPYAFKQTHVGEIERLADVGGRRPQVRLIDGEWASWYGSRAIEGLDRLARAASDAARETAFDQST